MSIEELSAIAKVIKAAGGVGSYLAKIFGSIPEDTLGLVVGDWLQHKRRRNLAALQSETSQIIQTIGWNKFTEPSPSILIPILQAAADESRTELQSLWAALLANAMTDNGKKVRRAFIETLKSMDPIDAQVLYMVSRIPPRSKLLSQARLRDISKKNPDHTDIFVDQAREGAWQKFIRKACKEIDLSEVEFETSLFSLEQNRCVAISSYNSPIITIFGKSLLDACSR